MAVLRGALNFRLFRVPIQVQLWFGITMLFISINRLQPLFDAPFLSITTFLECIIVATIAVLVHELAHAFAFRRYGQEPSIVLWGLGGLTYGQSKLSPGRDIVTSAVGPLAGIVLMGLPAWALQHYVLPGRLPFNELGALAAVTVNDVKWFALIWSLINLLPLIPLDGGHITEAVLQIVKGEPQKQTRGPSRWSPACCSGR